MSYTFSCNELGTENTINSYRKYLQENDFIYRLESIIPQSTVEEFNVFSIDPDILERLANEKGESFRRFVYEEILRGDSILRDIKIEAYKRGGIGIAYAIDNLMNMVGEQLNTLIEYQKITHLLLSNISVLLRLSDAQKARASFIEEGLKYLQNAFREGATSSWYKESLLQFKKAIDIEPNDFFSLYYYGFIYLKSTNYLSLDNLKKAENYFRKSARYYSAEALVGGTTFSKYLLPSNLLFSLGASQAYLYAAEACYLQGDIDSALTLSKSASEAYPNLTKALFYTAKYMAVKGDFDQANALLHEVIKHDPRFMNRAFEDEDIIQKMSIRSFLEEIKAKAQKEANDNIRICNKEKLDHSSANKYISDAQGKIQSEDYKEVVYGNKLLLQSRKWLIEKGAEFDNIGYVLPIIRQQSFDCSVMKFVKLERNAILAIPIAERRIKIDKIQSDRQKLISELLTKNNEIAKQTITQNNEIAEEKKERNVMRPVGIALILFLLLLGWVQKALKHNMDVRASVGMLTLFGNIALILLAIWFFTYRKKKIPERPSGFSSVITKYDEDIKELEDEITQIKISLDFL